MNDRYLHAPITNAHPKNLEEAIEQIEELKEAIQELQLNYRELANAILTRTSDS